MRRAFDTVTFSGLLVALLTLSLGVGPLGSTVQGDVNGRLADLETTVADQADQIDDLDGALAALDDRLATLEAEGEIDRGGEEAPSGSGSGGDGDLALSGNGPSATDPFDLAAGSYRLEASCGAGFLFSLDIQRLDADEFVISTLIGSPPYSGSEVLTVEGGRYVISVTCDGAWTIDVTRLG